MTVTPSELLREAIEALEPFAAVGRRLHPGASRSDGVACVYGLNEHMQPVTHIRVCSRPFPGEPTVGDYLDAADAVAAYRMLQKGGDS